MKLDVYENLLRINAGYDQAIRSLAALRKHGAFHRGALARFASLSKEDRSRYALRRSARPKNNSPFQRVPVTSRAMALKDRYRRVSNSKPSSSTVTTIR